MKAQGYLVESPIQIKLATKFIEVIYTSYEYYKCVIMFLIINYEYIYILTGDSKSAVDIATF